MCVSCPCEFFNPLGHLLELSSPILLLPTLLLQDLARRNPSRTRITCNILQPSTINTQSVATVEHGRI